MWSRYSFGSTTTCAAASPSAMRMRSSICTSGTDDGSVSFILIAVASDITPGASSPILGGMTHSESSGVCVSE